MTVTQSPAPPWTDRIPRLGPKGELALLARLLHHEGYDDHLAGHLSYRQPDGTILVNPFELLWDEVTAADVMRIDIDGNVLEGRWSVTPAITLHLELHKSRRDVCVAVHNHSRWGTIWADAHRVPPIYDQASALVCGDLVLHDEYDGDVQSTGHAAAAVRDLGAAPFALLANHGVFVVGESIRQAHHRCIVLEWRCRNAWHVEALGGGVAMGQGPVDAIAVQADGRHGWPHLFEAMALKEIRKDPALLEGDDT